MKIDGLKHPKTKELAYSLEIPLPHAIGLLELLWAFVGQQTPQGNIGKWSNAVIAGEAGWQKCPDAFVNALISVKFLDESDEHRLLVHDWFEHAPNWVHAKLKRKGRYILSADLSRDLRGDLSKSQEASIEATTNVVKPSLAKSNQAKPIKTIVKSKKPDCDDRALSRLVFEHWQQAHNHPRAKLDAKRRKVINARLNDGYTLDDLLSAIDGCKRSPFHQGQNKDATKYDDIELICRSGKHVDQFIKISTEPDYCGLSASGRKSAQSAQEFLDD